METRLLKTTGYVFCLFGLFFFIKNVPFLWHLNSVSHSNHFIGLTMDEEYLFWFKFGMSIILSVLVPFSIGLSFLKIKKG